MKIYHSLSKLIPESKFKNRLRNLIYGKLFLVTHGYKIVTLDKLRNIRGKFYKQLFIDYNYDIPLEIRGYQLHYTPKKGDIVIDVGTYIGEFAIYASKLVGKNGRVICFEPDKANMKLLKRNIKLNRLDNITLIEKGLWNKDGVLKFKTFGAGSVFEKFDDSKNLVNEVEVVKLDTILKKLNISKVNMIKMDIEGAEIEALEGCKETMKKNDVYFAIASYHTVNGEKTCKELTKIFNQLKYKSITEYPAHLTTYAQKHNF